MSLYIKYILCNYILYIRFYIMLYSILYIVLCITYYYIIYLYMCTIIVIEPLNDFHVLERLYCCWMGRVNNNFNFYSLH